MDITTIKATIDLDKTSKEFSYSDYFPYSYTREYKEIGLQGNFSEIVKIVDTMQNMENTWTVQLHNDLELELIDLNDANSFIYDIDTDMYYGGWLELHYNHFAECLYLLKHYYIEDWNKDVTVFFIINKNDILALKGFDMSRIEVIERELFKFEELSEDAQQKAIEDNQYTLVDYGWFSQDDVRAVAQIMGIEIKHIYFDVENCQGRGACFDGEYAYSVNSLQKIKEYAPNDKELHEIVALMQNVQRKNFYKLTAKIVQSGRYCHSGCTEIAVYKDGDYFFDTRDSYVKNNIEDGAQLVVLLRRFMAWIFTQINADYKDRTSDEAVKETLIINEYEFLADGTMV